MSPSLSEVWSIASSIASIILALFAIFLAIYLYVKTKSTEQAVTNSLCEIKSQTETLTKLNSKWMDRLIKGVTDGRPQIADPSISQLLTALSQLPQSISMQFTQPNAGKEESYLTEQLINAHIAVYYYSALTNYWSQFFIPRPDEFSADNPMDN
jgi:uncharacterized protein YoxC